MNGERLNAARRTAGWTQAEAASRLGVSQPYYSQLESGSRPFPAEFALAALRLFHLSPVTLPLPALDPNLAPLDPSEVSAQLAGFAYPGFAYLQKPSQPMNPAAAVAASLVHPDLDPRLVEALPWVLIAFPDLDWNWLIDQCRLTNQQNRLGYLVLLAKELTQPRVPHALANALFRLEPSRLAQESTLCRESMSAAERIWVRQHRPAAAVHWNLLTTLTADQLAHAT